MLVFGYDVSTCHRCNLLKTTYLYSIDVILLAMLLLLYYSMFSFYIACLYTKNDIQTKSKI